MDPIVKPAPKMRGFGRRIAAFLIALGVGFALFLAPAVAPKTSPVLAPTPAQAGECTVVIGIEIACGTVKNQPNSKSKIYVYDSWTSNRYRAPESGGEPVTPGNTGRAKDQDGFKLPLGYYGTVRVVSLFQDDTYRVGGDMPLALKIQDHQIGFVHVIGMEGWYSTEYYKSKSQKAKAAKYTKAAKAEKAKAAKYTKAAKAAKTKAAKDKYTKAAKTAKTWASKFSKTAKAAKAKAAKIMKAAKDKAKKRDEAAIKRQG